jgi:transcriptional regulator with XRE-family HTH domain
MFEQYVRNRITELRLHKGVSEYQMSLDLGHGKNYIRAITSGRTLPSLTELPYICEYLGVSVKDFFDDSAQNPVLVHELMLRAKKLDTEDLIAIINLMDRIKPFDKDN